MKAPHITKFTCLFVLLIFAPNLLLAQWGNGQAADMVFGQSGFTSATTGNGSANLNHPTDIVVSAISKKVFIADYGNNRILRYNSYLSYNNGDNAELVINNLSTAGTFGPAALFIDQYDNLWIVDTDKHRVLKVPDASILNNDALPTQVFGQPDFTTVSSGSTTDKMFLPKGIFVDDIRNILWVCDTHNHRILRFDNVSSLSNGSSANVVLGTGAQSVPAAPNRFFQPSDVYIDYLGNLWVTDYIFSRVLRFSDAHTLSSGSSANAVLGQPDFTSWLPQSPSQTSVSYPTGIYGDNGGRLYVSIGGNLTNRILVFKNAAFLTNNAPADFVIGKSNFSTGGFAATESALNLPQGIFVDDYLWVADSDNNRALRYSPISTLPVTLTSFTAKSQTPGNITLEWQTATEIDNSHFEIQLSENGKTFVKVASVNSKAENGNSSAVLKYSYTINKKNFPALAGLGSLLTLLLLPAVRNRIMKALMVVLVLSAFIACQKQEGELEKTVYVKLVQIDNDGKTTELGIKVVKV